MLCRHDRHVREPLAQLGGTAVAADDIDDQQVVELAHARHQPPDRRARGGLHQEAVVSEGQVLLCLTAQHHRGERVHHHVRGGLVRQLVRNGDDHLGVRHDPLGPCPWVEEDRYAAADLDTRCHAGSRADRLHHAGGLHAARNRLCSRPGVGFDGQEITAVYRESRGADEDLAVLRRRLRLFDDGQDVG
jgi:hypothetical protein